MISMCKHLVGEFQHSVAVSFSAIFDLHVSSTDDYFTVLFMAMTEICSLSERWNGANKVKYEADIDTTDIQDDT